MRVRVSSECKHVADPLMRERMGRKQSDILIHTRKETDCVVYKQIRSPYAMTSNNHFLMK